MPLYEYECAECRKRFERLQKFADPPIETCPACGGHVSRLLSSPAIQFKGSGWYVTDYARASGASEKKSPDAEKSQSGSSQSDKSEAGEKPSKETPHPAKTSKPESGKPGKKKN